MENSCGMEISGVAWKSHQENDQQYDHSVDDHLTHQLDQVDHDLAHHLSLSLDLGSVVS